MRLAFDGTAQISGDRLMLRRALSNLLSNAIRHAPSDTTVKVRLEARANDVFVHVANAGPAIDPEMLPRLFDRFFRADKSRRQADSDGAGLGLSITQAIVRAHRGELTVQSEQDATRFTMQFPRTLP